MWKFRSKCCAVAQVSRLRQTSHLSWCFKPPTGIQSTALARWLAKTSWSTWAPPSVACWITLFPNQNLKHQLRRLDVVWNEMVESCPKCFNALFSTHQGYSMFTIQGLQRIKSPINGYDAAWRPNRVSPFQPKTGPKRKYPYLGWDWFLLSPKRGLEPAHRWTGFDMVRSQHWPKLVLFKADSYALELWCN